MASGELLAKLRNIYAKADEAVRQWNELQARMGCAEQAGFHMQPTCLITVPAAAGRHPGKAEADRHGPREASGEDFTPRGLLSAPRHRHLPMTATARPPQALQEPGNYSALRSVPDIQQKLLAKQMLALEQHFAELQTAL